MTATATVPVLDEPVDDQATRKKAVSDRARAASKAVRRRKLTESERVFASQAERRLVKPVTVTGVDLARYVTTIKPADFDKLNVDESYQRVRIGTEVNDLIHVLKAGGQVVDPIDIAERPDGSWWIVDGQQRYWAHYETQLPIRANIHKVKDIQSETKLFLTLNQRRKVSARIMVKGWPGPSGDFLRRMNSDPKSPVFGLIDMNTNSKLPLDAPSVVKGVLVATTGTLPHGEISKHVLPRVDAALRQPGRQHWAEEYIRLVATVFDMNRGAGRARYLPMVALARVAYKKFTAAGRPIFPRSTALLRRVNWDTIVPSHATRFLPLLESEIEKRWK